MSNKEPVPYTEKQEKFGTSLIRKIGKMQVWVYRATGGRIWNTFLGAQVCILTSTGRKSGQKRLTPLVYVEEGNNVIIAASKGGMSKPPVWKYNLDANPDCEVQIGSVNRKARARIACPEEEEDLWPKLTAVYAGFDEYRARTDGIRHIPLYILERD
ncbi:MAG: nitroreductase family deazaflavin-dependent oxidoreductase [Pseudomonadales bacterium]|nr:nitroreductase family deazaflavin-dependent oxidoreductase [Pseudomonadales bacterium]